MRAVRARRAALADGLADFELFLVFVLTGFEVLVPAAVVFFVFCAGFAAAFFGAVDVEAAGAVVVPPLADPLVDCAATGSTAISQVNRMAVQREAGRFAKVEETTDIISSL